MPGIRLTSELKDEYLRLFDTCTILPKALPSVTSTAEAIAAEQARYASIGDPLKIPWCAVGLLHYRECGLSFQKHLHNGDPLAARTVHVPAGRPVNGQPPFAFDASAQDALVQNGASAWKDWSLPGLLYRLEAFNGFGYRLSHPQVLSPYLWGQSCHYIRGGYPRDGEWSDTYVNKQLGSAVILRRLSELGHVGFGVDGQILSSAAPDSIWDTYADVRYAPDEVSAKAMELQKLLNRLPGVHLQEDGRAGARTAQAFTRASGRRLLGDPSASPL